MKAFFIIFKKEAVDTLRDRRTLITMIVLPLVIFPLIIGIVTRVSESQEGKAKLKELKVAIVSVEKLPQFEKIILQEKDMVLVGSVDEDSVRSYIKAETLDGAFVFSNRFSKRLVALKPGRLKFYFRSAEGQNIKKERMLKVVDKFEEQLLKERFVKLNLSETTAETINLTEVDIATTQERLGKAIGGFLPYIFVIFCFLGSMYPAIDLGAGEKERGTIETLLTTPVDRFVILLGKFGVVVLTGISSAIIALVGLYLGIRQAGEIPPDVAEVLASVLQPQTIVLLISLLLPLTMFFAGILLSMSMYAKTFKEAQSLITPVNLLIIVPVAVGLIPGVELNSVTALIPILNVSLSTREIVAGTMDFALLTEVYASLVLIAGLSLFSASRLFVKESVIFRG